MNLESTSLNTRCSRTLEMAVAALNMDGVEMERSLDTRLVVVVGEGGREGRREGWVEGGREGGRDGGRE